MSLRFETHPSRTFHIILCGLNTNMRLVVLYTLFIVLLVLGTAVDSRPQQGGRQCYHSNEIYTECGPACPQTCDSALAPEPVGCIALCVPGCFCKSGHVRNRWGNCIPEANCRRQ